METKVISGLSALAQATRLQAFRLLVKHEPEGLAAGEIARALDVPQNTLSSHLSILAQAGLVSSTRQATTIMYRANLEHLGAILSFLLKDCCAGRSEICAPLVADLTSSKCETC
jgi:ArsR family transcriptional regulator, arsenate/arsenite/antimonite-responsive transcriptional repressor